MTKQRLRFISPILFVLFLCCKSKEEGKHIEVSQNLKLSKVNDNGYVHISKIFLDNGKQYNCNGFVYVNDDEAFIFDTPSNDIATEHLIKWLQDDKNITIKGVVFNHFHRDCHEGMDIFKKYNIPSIASKRTSELMNQKEYESPDQVFEDSIVLHLGDKKIVNTFFGEAHSEDNIVSYFPDDQILFGGCMVKSLKASKGNLEDANTDEWSHTVKKVKSKYPEVQTVIPGHGKIGDITLLDYTISLFQK